MGLNKVIFTTEFFFGTFLIVVISEITLWLYQRAIAL